MHPPGTIPEYNLDIEGIPAHPCTAPRGLVPLK